MLMLTTEVFGVHMGLRGVRYSLDEVRDENSRTLNSRAFGMHRSVRWKTSAD